MFETELEYFVANQSELVNKYNGKTLVLRGQSVAGVYDSKLEAYLAARDQFGPGNFMLQPCEPGAAAYTVTIARSQEAAAR